MDEAPDNQSFVDLPTSRSRRHMALKQYYAEVAQLNGDEAFTVTEYPLVVRHKFPGFHPFVLDGSGICSVVKLMPFINITRNYSEHWPRKDGIVFLDRKNLIVDRMVFVSCLELKFSRSLYNSNIMKYSLCVKQYPRNIGNSSVSICTEISFPHEADPLIMETTQDVFVNRKTRRPQKLPQWFFDKFKGQTTEGGAFKLDPLQKPIHTFVHHIQVVWSDTDVNQHTNYSSYVRFALDGLHRAIAVQSGKLKIGTRTTANLCEDDDKEKVISPLKGISKDIIRNGVKNLKISYYKETLGGDALDVHVWQDPGEVFIVKSIIEKDGQNCCHITIEYYTPVSNL